MSASAPRHSLVSMLEVEDADWRDTVDWAILPFFWVEHLKASVGKSFRRYLSHFSTFSFGTRSGA
jgi:hypothetical protein